MKLDRNQGKRKYVDGIPQSFKMALAVRIARRLFPALCDGKTASTPAAESIEKIICHMESFCRDPSAACTEMRLGMERRIGNPDDFLQHIVEEKARETAAPATPDSPILVIDSSRYDRIADALSAALRLWEIERPYILKRSKFSNADLRDSYVNQQAFVALKNEHWRLLTETVLYAWDASVAVDPSMEDYLWKDLEISHDALDTTQDGVWAVWDPVPDHLYLIPSEFDVGEEAGDSPIREIILAVDDKLIAYFRKHPNRLKELSPRQFEEVICEIVSGFGWNARLTAQTRDQGYDIFAVDDRDDAPVKQKYLIECKRYTDRPVGVGAVRSLHSVTETHKGSTGILVTTTHFTKPGRALLDRHEWVLKGLGLEGLLKWLELYQRLKLSRDIAI